jgi:UDP-glucose 4-epimerase
VDIARAHVAALEKMNTLEDFEIFNIGTGKGSSVLEIINKASEVLNRIIPMERGQRRPGDYEQSVADDKKIKEKLNFLPQYSDLETIITSSWKQMNS